MPAPRVSPPDRGSACDAGPFLVLARPAPSFRAAILLTARLAGSVGIGARPATETVAAERAPAGSARSVGETTGLAVIIRSPEGISALQALAATVILPHGLGFSVLRFTRSTRRSSRDRAISVRTALTQRCSIRDPKRCLRRDPPHTLHRPNRLLLLPLLSPVPPHLKHGRNGHRYSDPAQVTSRIRAVSRAAAITGHPPCGRGQALTPSSKPRR